MLASPVSVVSTLKLRKKATNCALASARTGDLWMVRMTGLAVEVISEPANFICDEEFFLRI